MPEAIKQQRKSYNLHLKHIQLPLDNRFAEQIQTVIDEVNSQSKLKVKLQEKMAIAFELAARAIIEGLYQAYGSRYKKCNLSVPTSKSGYGSKPHQIKIYSHTAVIKVIEALQGLGWIHKKGA